jgi:hypothetical protein
MAYVAFGSSSPLVLSGGLSLIDVSDPTSPQHVGSCTLGGWALQVAVNGDFAYVAVAGKSDGGVTGGDLQVIDVRDPANPHRIGGYGSSGTGAIGVATDAHNVYLASAADGAMHVIDPDNATSPQRVGRYRAPEYARRMAVAGDFVYLLAGGLHVIELRRANLQRVGHYDTSGYTHDVVVSGNLAYVADDSAGLQVVDVTDPAHPEWVATYEPGNDTEVLAVEVAEDRVYARVAWRDISIDPSPRGRLDALEMRASGVLERIAVYSLEDWISDVEVAGPFAYITAWDWYGSGGRLDIIEISNPGAFQRIGTYTTEYRPHQVVVSGGTAYLATGDQGSESPGRLELVDVSDAANPRMIGSYESDWRVESVTVSGSVAYLGIGTGGSQMRPFFAVRFVDVSDSGNPREVSGWGGRWAFNHVLVSDGFLYMEAGIGGYLMDTRDPANPRRVDGYDFGYRSGMSTAYIGDDYLYVADGYNGLIILNKYIELRIGPAIVLSDGRVQLQLSGVNGQCVRVQRSANLIDWEDWRTVALDGTGCELIDETATASHRFYRAVEDNSGAGE